MPLRRPETQRSGEQAGAFVQELILTGYAVLFRIAARTETYLDWLCGMFLPHSRSLAMRASGSIPLVTGGGRRNEANARGGGLSVYGDFRKRAVNDGGRAFFARSPE